MVINKVNIPSLGRLNFVRRTKWKYSPDCVAKEDEVKKLKKWEEHEGIAEVEKITTSISARATNKI